MKTKLLKQWAFAMFTAFTAVVTSQAAGKQPNVVFILADNVGYGDLGPYGGGELRGCPTPRIDQLAREGLRLTQFLVEPACTPSRAALMTGQYSIRSGLSLIIIPGTPNTLSKDAFTMGQLFKGAGYATAIFGKWHLGIEPQSLPDSARLRRVLRHFARRVVGLVHLRRHDRDDALDPRAARCAAGEGPANRRSRGGRSAAQGQAVHAGSPRRDRQ